MDFNSLKHYQRDAIEDINILRSLLPSLSLEEQIAIKLRFWENMTVDEIATILHLSWSNTDRLLDESIQKLRRGFEKVHQDRNLLAAS